MKHFEIIELSRDDGKDFANKLATDGKILDLAFAPGGTPVHGVAYWKYFVSKFEGNLYVVETSFDEKNEVQQVFKRITY